MRSKRHRNQLRNNANATEAPPTFGAPQMAAQIKGVGTVDRGHGIRINTGAYGHGTYSRRNRTPKRRSVERPELFLIPNDTIFAINADETEATYLAMEELGIANLPYPLVDIGVEGSLIMRIQHKDDGGHRIQLALPGQPNYEDAVWSQSVAEAHDPLTCPSCMQKVSHDAETSFAKVVDGKTYPAGTPMSEVFAGLEQNSPYNVAYCEDDIKIGNIVEPHQRPEFKRRFSSTEELRESVEHLGTPFKEWSIRFRYEHEVPIIQMLIHPGGRAYDMGKILEPSESKSAQDAAKAIRKILIVLLATRNIVKERTKDKLLAMGIGSRKNNFRPLYTTTLSLPKTVTRDDGQPANVGSPRRPHLRRGHIRHQKYGPRLAFTKLIWIEPCFINADENFVSERSAYNTSAGTNNPLVSEQSSLTNPTEDQPNA